MDISLNLSPSTLQYLSGAFTTLLGAVAVHFLTMYREHAKEKKRRKAIRILFANVILSFANQRNDGLPWSNVLWNKRQFDIAMYFPEEVFRFSCLIADNKPDALRLTYRTASQESALELAKKLLKQEE